MSTLKTPVKKKATIKRYISLPSNTANNDGILRIKFISQKTGK